MNSVSDLSRRVQEYKSNAQTLETAIKGLPIESMTIADAFVKAYSVINSPKYEKILVSISGGADSDVVLDICSRCDRDQKCTYVWIDTGLEYQATKNHLDDLEKIYGIKILRVRAKMPVPVSCKKYGQPFISKTASEYIYRLQLNNFEWEDKPYDELIKRYPNCKSALMWWCNLNKAARLNISYNKWLKEFMILNPIPFKVSNMCCQKAKKDAVHDLLKGYDLNIYGVRKAEGGARSSIPSCFSVKDGYSEYRPVFWYSNLDKKEYCDACDICHSDCYTEYGLKRTGCCGCPFGRDFEYELKVVRKYEPKFYKAINNIFKDSYDYTRKYREFANKMNYGI